jgi:uncharacterized membrane protein
MPMTTTVQRSEPAIPQGPPADRMLLRPWPRWQLAGVAGAAVAAAASFTPSLLPRDWLLQGAVTGISAAIGYPVGLVLAWLVYGVTGWRPSRRARRSGWSALAVVGVPAIGLAVWAGHRWQHEVHLLMGRDPPESSAWLRIVLVALVVLAVLVEVGRVLTWLVWRLTWRLRHRLPDRLARAPSVVLVALLLIGVNDGLLWRGVVMVMNHSYGALDQLPPEETEPPTRTERSGSPTSLVAWDTLGRKGQEFVTGGPTTAELGAFAGGEVQLPVRVYAGLRSADSAATRAALAVEELERAGGFEREILVVATTTGTGMIDPAMAAAVEYLHAGDTATVGIQYSYLPSWISFLADADRAQEAGRELFEEVHDAWASRPADDRPALLVAGVSLGAFGAEAAFSGLTDLQHRTDGALFAGAPHDSVLRRRLLEDREPGSPQWLPVHDEGRTVRFAARPEDLVTPGPRWDPPRVVYLQHGSDPIVFWSPRLAVVRPAWLSEPPAPDVARAMRWIPGVTFWQVSADLPFSLDAPAGHGHHYRELFADAWAAVVPPPGWSPADTERLRDVLGGGEG